MLKDVLGFCCFWQRIGLLFIGYFSLVGDLSQIWKVALIANTVKISDLSNHQSTLQKEFI